VTGNSLALTPAVFAIRFPPYKEHSGCVKSGDLAGQACGPQRPIQQLVCGTLKNPSICRPTRTSVEDRIVAKMTDSSMNNSGKKEQPTVLNDK
jgi:hypothetical protein